MAIQTLDPKERPEERPKPAAPAEPKENPPERRPQADHARKAERLIARFQAVEAKAQPLIEATRKGRWRMGQAGWEVVDEAGTVLWSEATAPIGMGAL